MPIEMSSKLVYLHDPTLDNGLPKPVLWFEPAIAFALTALCAPGNVVYVPCDAGVNRGPSMCYAIMRALGLGGGRCDPPDSPGESLYSAWASICRSPDRAVRALGTFDAI
jgi:hypothetical protein